MFLMQNLNLEADVNENQAVFEENHMQFFNVFTQIFFLGQIISTMQILLASSDSFISFHRKSDKTAIFVSFVFLFFLTLFLSLTS